MPVLANRGFTVYNADMKRDLTRLSVGLVTVLSLTVGGSDLVAEGKAKGCPAGSQPDVLKQQLNGAASAAIAAIKSGKPENLIPLFAVKGVFLGVDGPLMSISSIREQMSKKTGIYCLVFDSSCLRKEVNESRQKAGAITADEEILSFRDHILKSDPVIKTALWADASCGGTTSDGSPLFDLEWERTSTGWRIVAIPYL
jgi:hypothetical protein